MGIEIERKFLVTSDAWRDGSPGVRLAQGYLTKGRERTVRVRIGGEKAWLTIKGPTRGISRPEFEYEIPAGDARELLRLCVSSVVEKTRHRVAHAGHVWEVDVFHGENEGLVIAEIELALEGEFFEIPPWLGREVSHEGRYSNSRLAAEPYRMWAD